MKIKIIVNNQDSDNSTTSQKNSSVKAEDNHHDATNVGVDADIEITKHKKGPHSKETL